MGRKQLPETLTLIRDNIMQYDNPLAVSARENAEWAADLNLPKQGDILFYTGRPKTNYGIWHVIWQLNPLLNESKGNVCSCRRI